MILLLNNTINMITNHLPEYYLLPDVEPNDVVPTELDASTIKNEINIKINVIMAQIQRCRSINYCFKKVVLNIVTVIYTILTALFRLHLTITQIHTKILCFWLHSLYSWLTHKILEISRRTIPGRVGLHAGCTVILNMLCNSSVLFIKSINNIYAIRNSTRVRLVAAA